MVNRENRGENRRKAASLAKEVANENAGNADIKDVPSGFNIGDMVEEFITGGEIDEEEEIVEASGSGIKDAPESESDEEIAAPSGVKKAKEEGFEEEETSGKSGGEVKKAEEVAAGEKTVEEEKPEEKKEEGILAEKPAPVEEKKGEKPSKEGEEPHVLTDEEAATLFGEWREKTESALAEHHYRLSEKDVEALNENPAAFIPRAMSRVYMDSISAAFQQFVTYLPRMVNQVVEQRKLVEEKENSFFKEWPDLLPHKGKIIRLGQAYKQANPTATDEEFINEVGAQAMVALRITPQNSDMKRQEEKPAEKKGFKPATGSASASGPTAKKVKNPFEELVEEFAREADADAEI